MRNFSTFALVRSTNHSLTHRQILKNNLFGCSKLSIGSTCSLFTRHPYPWKRTVNINTMRYSTEQSVDHLAEVSTNTEFLQTSINNNSVNLESLNKFLAKMKAEVRKEEENFGKPYPGKNQFSLYMKKRMKEMPKDMNISVYLKQIGKEWSQLPQEEKNKYIEEFQIIKEQSNHWDETHMVKYMNKEPMLDKMMTAKLLKSKDAPKKPAPANHLFFAANRAAVRAQNPDLNAVEIIKLLRNMWTKCDLKEKRMYIDEYTKNFIEFKKQLNEYLINISKERMREVKNECLLEYNRDLLTKSKKQINFPKKPIMPFLHYKMDMYKVKPKEMGYKEWTAMCSEQWRNEPIEKKQVYYDLYEKSKMKYETELAEWEKKMRNAPHESTDLKSATSFFLFFQEMKPELLEKFPDATPYDLIKEASNAWSSLSKEKKDSYSTYMRKRESEHTNPSSPESLLQKYSKLHRKKLLINNLKYVIKKQEQLLNKPKRPLTSYFLFLKMNEEEKPEGMRSLAWNVKLGEKWANMPDIEKQKYADMSKELFDEYHRKMKIWKENNLKKPCRDHIQEPEKELSEIAVCS